MKRINYGFAILLCLWFFVSSVSAQKMILEDFNDETLAPGFDFFDGEGVVIPNETDNETWSIWSAEGAWGGWNNFESSAITSPAFQADEFKVSFSIRNIVRESQSDWDCIVVLISGLEEDLLCFLGSSAANGELNPEYALYAEIQHPNKDNGYIWDSAVNLNNQEVPSPWKDYIDEFPDTIEWEIVFHGPEQPLDMYFNFDGAGKFHLLQWADSEPSNTFDSILAQAEDTYSVTIHANNGGADPSLIFGIDNFKISGPIVSEFAVDDPDADSQVSNWQLF